MSIVRDRILTTTVILRTTTPNSLSLNGDRDRAEAMKNEWEMIIDNCSMMLAAKFGKQYCGICLTIAIGLSPATASANTLPNSAIPLFPEAPAAPPTNANSSSDAPYTLGTGDRIKIDIFDVPEYSGEYQVLFDGTLNLPILGSLQVRDLTLQQLTALLSRRYAPYIVEPIITLSLTSTRPIQIAVAGEVNRPGTYTVVLGQGRTFPTLLEALGEAGGTTRSAQLQQVRVRRIYQGREQNFTANLSTLLQNGDISQNLSLRDGDTVIVPTATEVDLNNNLASVETSFSNRDIDPFPVAVVGEVTRPGTHVMEATRASNPPTVTRAIEAAGGIKPLADIRRVRLRRLTKTGEQFFELNLWELLQAGDLRQDAVLQRGDTIVVPQATEQNPAEASLLASATFAPTAIKVNVAGEVVRSGVIELPPNSTLNQALLAAGGINNRGDGGDVALVRLNPDGTVSRREIRIDFEQNINEETNPILRNNDVVIVGKTQLANFSDQVGQLLEPLGRGFSLFTFPFNFLRIFGVN
ncbi:SLBB domain-containing protein [Oscillatoria sp. FACHB-1406]|uniref:SLBB domain-containing protein n=1 Tax=Oscillatoria sp. FACHB-1406 TaxID=2692846 RepID=UPI0016892567|nr:SLBB domain-containing protein [Oscillatoria sp. FACHB-1406]MBD2579800.1 SLBB domain-containing protein [Oscillatoria sp. FACHB-1406]